MQDMWAAICDRPTMANSVGRNESIDPKVAAGASVVGWDCPCDWRVGSLAAIVCKRFVCPASTNGSSDVKKKRRLTVQCDELWSFVGMRRNKVWLWLALDADTREIVAVHVGDRSRQSAHCLWANVPAVYRQCAVCYTDNWAAYVGVLPSKRHRIVAKGSGKTNYIERFNNTLRQRLARLTRQTLAFSKKHTNHIGAIWFFIHHYNALRSAALSLPF